jgi:hypothetical protein
VTTTAARTEFPAAERFSARINSVEEMAGGADMQELSPRRRNAPSNDTESDECRASASRWSARFALY